ncbi:MAG: transposase [Firmicutes bacterium]|nr:transposase [Bacillota bacterium]
MPRNVREKSSSGIYHIILKGINKQRIFEDDEDSRFFLEKLITYKEISGYELYAYCLMSNHVHLLLKEGEESIGTVFRRIGASYVYWYNRKYNRTGHLFQDRYRSEPVETDQYFLTVMRYIHQNPIKAGIIEKIEDYPWSSYRDYSQKPLICDTKFVLNMFSKVHMEALELWVKFIHEKNNDQCMEHDAGRLNDDEATELIKSVAKVKNPMEIQAYEKKTMNALIKLLKEKGLSIRQIERLTGVSFGVIRGA